MYKALEIANWFLQYNARDRKINSDVEGISNLKLQKLLYYAQGCYLALYGTPLFSDHIVAWQHGPVVIDVYNKYKSFGSSSITMMEEPLELSEIAKNVLTWVYNEFGQYTAWGLRNMTHKETPWLETKIKDVIDTEIIKRYFLEHYVET